MLSVSPTFINLKKAEGKAYATTLEEFKKDVDKPLIAILTLNTIAHTVGAILVGNEAAKIYGGEADGTHGGGDLLSPVFVISSIMTILILVVSEIIPKTIGATYWKPLSAFTASALRLLIAPLKYTGILWLLQRTTKMIGKGGAHGDSVLSRQDFAAMAEIGEQEGALNDSESRIISNLLRFDNIYVKNIMTPRTVMVSVSETMTLEQFYAKYPSLRFSRIPIYHEHRDNVNGMFLKDRLLLEMAKGNGNATVGSISSPIEMIHEEATISQTFNRFLENRIHLALVIDEYGGTQGVVTMEDVMETLLGLEIMDESDNAADMQHLARQRWKERAKKLGLIEQEGEEE